jgi:cell division septation protein DedD
MRDLDRLQDVVEYRVTPGQLRIVFLGVLAVACAIFAVGVSVGKRFEPASPGVAVDPLAQLDQAGLLSDNTEDDQDEAEPTPLTYHSELTDQSANSDSEADEENTGEPAAGDGDASDSDDGASADERMPSEPAQPERPNPGESSVFTLQVASFEAREEAQQFASDLRSRGHSVFLVRTSTPARGTWYRVRVGPFHNRRDATRYQVRFERTERLPTFLVQRRR